MLDVYRRTVIMRSKTRDLVYIAVFGALWGAIEVTSGSILHVINIPFSGAMLSAIGIAIALIGRLFVPRRGSVLYIGLVAAFLKMFSLGGIVMMPMVGIIMESLLAEIVLSVMGQPRRLSFMVAGAAAVCWTLVHPFFTQGLLAGQGIFTVYSWTLQKGAKMLGLPPSAIPVILGLLLAGHILIGVAAGLVAWDAGKVIEKRLQSPLGTGESA
jgi:hypothetical protein